MRQAKAGAALALILAVFYLTDRASGSPVLSPLNLRILNPGITAQTDNQTVIAGENATFTVTAVGDAPLTYEWTFNGIIAGSTSNTYTRLNCKLADNGARVRATVSNGSGTVQSSEATLAVYPTGTNFYVAVNGSTGNTGRSTNSPWSMQHGLNHFGPGITLIVMPGLYTGAFHLYNHSGAATNPAIVRAQSKWTAVLANSTAAGLDIFNSSHVVIDGLCVSNAASAGIANYSAYNTVRNCRVVNNAGLGLDFSASGISNNVVESTLIELSGRGVWGGNGSPRYHGLYISGANNVIRNNVLRHNAGWGIHLYTGYAASRQNNNLIYNNLTYGHTNFYGVTVWGASDSAPGGVAPGTNYLFNNTILDGVQLCYGTAWVTNNIILPSSLAPSTPMYASRSYPPTVWEDYNLGTNGINPAGPHNVIANASPTTLFVNPAKGLYWLAAASPARNKAKPDVIGPADFFGNVPTSVSDIGAFQYNTKLADDPRDLEPSAADPDYWLLP